MDFTGGSYSAEELEGSPGTASAASLGCGNTTALATLSPGEIVSDLPAVTVAFTLTRHFPWSRVPGYVAAQRAGACAASAAHLVLFGDVANPGATVPSGSPSRQRLWSRS